MITPNELEVPKMPNPSEIKTKKMISRGKSELKFTPFNA
jgi:hypothetical protein